MKYEIKLAKAALSWAKKQLQLDTVAEIEAKEAYEQAGLELDAATEARFKSYLEYSKAVNALKVLEDGPSAPVVKEPPVKCGS